MRGNIKDSKILIVDDEEGNVLLLEELLQHDGYTNFRSTSDPRQVMELFSDYQPDLILMDWQMPYLDGYTLMKQIASRVPADNYLPIVVLTADLTPQTRERALSLSAKDFITKPFDCNEVLLRIRNLLETRDLHLRLQNHNELLEATVAERTRELEQAQIETLERLANAAEFRDDNTGQHTRRIGETSALLAKTLGMPPEWIELIRRAAPLHDLGKIGIPDRILLKPGKLTAEEFEVMKTHVHIGARILSGSRSPALQMAEVIALTHHERWDGKGYGGLQSDTIPLEGRIVAVADVFDALSHARPYKHAWSTEECVAELQKLSGRHLDPNIVRIFLEIIPEVLEISRQEHDLLAKT
jgi:putative two-component system response regulator